ncbi:MAG: hypothetical protein Salg2KO_18800 [Salibacteraceae bacterium]
MACVVCEKNASGDDQGNDEKNDDDNAALMSEEKNIDDLFRSKLAGREVNYSAASWSGASSLLDQHFKMLFLKKALLVLLPILFISGAGILWIQDEQTAYTEREGHISEIDFAWQEVSIDRDAQSVSETAQPKERPIDQASIAGSMKHEEQSGAIEKQSPAKQNSKVVAPTEVFDVSEASSPEPKKNSNSVVATSAERNSQGTLAFESSINPFKHPTVSTELAAYKLKSDVGYMDIAQFKNDYTSAILDRSQESPVARELRKIQLFAEAGILVARGMNRGAANHQPIGLGAHARLLMKYHLGEAVYLDFGVGAYSRGALPDGSPFVGASGNTVSINPAFANYGSILIATGYRIGARHAVGIGFEVNPLLSIAAQKQEQVIGESASRETWVMDNTGFSTLDAAFVANYRLSIAERLDATSELHFGFIDATDNNIFSGAGGADHNTFVKLGLAYRITSR